MERGMPLKQPRREHPPLRDRRLGSRLCSLRLR
jgi:hypothetical protein